MAEKQYGETLTPGRNLEKKVTVVVQEGRPVRLARGRDWSCEVLKSMLKI